MIKSFFLVIVSTFLYITIFSQPKWEVANDSITLSPDRIFGQGSIAVLNGKSGGALSVNGLLEINMKEKVIFFNDGKNFFKLKNQDLENISIPDYGTFSSEDLFKDYFSDSILQHYRRLLYNSLPLNEITFSSSKRVEYGIENNTLVLKNQKISTGKLCYSDLNNIVILDSDGEIEKFQDGDFNFLEMTGFKGFSCKEFYDYLFLYFQKRLDQNINDWTERAKKMSIEELIDVFGPFDNLTIISPDKKLITWRKNSMSYYLNISTTNSNHIFSSGSFFSTRYSIINSLFSNISPFFLYGNSYRTTDVSLTGNTNTTSSNFTNQTGRITSKDEGSIFSIIQDSNNKTIQLFQKNIFSEPQYGLPFKFISY